MYEVKLDDDFLMSSLFTVAEVELARLGAGPCARRPDLDVVVGGLGLGYTAEAVLEPIPGSGSWSWWTRSRPVIDWHRRGLVPARPGPRR